GLRSSAEEIFFTESRIIKLSQILKAMDQQGRAGDSLRKRVSETAESFSDLKGLKKASIGELVQEASALRVSLQKIYERTLQDRNESQRRWLMGLGSLIFLGILVIMGIGYRKLDRMGKTLFLFLLIGGSISFFACSSDQVEPAKKSAAQERLEQSFQAASQSLGRMEEAFYQAYLLADMAREWSKMDRNAAEKAFQLAWQMALRARENVDQIKGLKEVLSQWPDQGEARKKKVNFDLVLDLRDELRQAEGLTWVLRAVAEQWVQVDEKKGRRALEFVYQEALKIEDGEFRDRDLKAIADAWAGIDGNRAAEIARSIREPFLKALALTKAALSTRGKERARHLFNEAWKEAESIPSPYPKMKAFIRISAAAARTNTRDKKAWAGGTFSQIQSLPDHQLQALAMQELVRQWAPLDWEQADRWASGISPGFPAERAYAFIHVARRNAEIPREKAENLLKRALIEASKIDDPCEAQKIKTLVVKGFTGFEPEEALRILPQLEDPFYRSEILGALAEHFPRKDKRGALELAEKIPLEPFRTKTVVRIVSQWMLQEREKINSIYQEAAEAASLIPDPYSRVFTLIELGQNWGRLERERGAALLEEAGKLAKEIFSPSRKAEIFEALAEAWKKADQARALIILEGIDPEVIRARKSLEEIRLLLKIDPPKAYQWAEAFPSSFPMEKAIALDEVARSMKSTQPALASDIFLKSLEQVLSLPDRPRRNKLLSQLITEAALLDKEKTFQRLLRIEDRETRELLLREAGLTWLKEDSLRAMKAASEISEGSLRCALYQKIAEREARKPEQSQEATLIILSELGWAREKAKKDESQAIPHLAKAVQEIEKFTDLRDRTYLLSWLAAEWAAIDEGKALEVAEKIPAHFSEPLSYTLLQVGTQLRKWNRKEAESVFQKTLSAANQIQDSSLRARRLLQLAKQWQMIDQEKAKALLEKAENEIKKGVSSPAKREKILREILLAQANLEPGEVSAIARNAGQPDLQARILLESAKVFSKVNIEENIKTLDKAWPYAQKAKNARLMGEIAGVWFALDAPKSLEALSQVEPKGTRIKALRQMALHYGLWQKEKARNLLEQATQEALGMDGLKEKLMHLREIAQDWTRMDKERARANYLKVYHLIEKAELSSPKF
ncbi:MAG: hypothetical protein HY882_10625, partial [Deltaproteobacteria bacterium]|nr:hypothetical protein [Deltaproteobacteria bacterium]